MSQRQRIERAGRYYGRRLYSRTAGPMLSPLRKQAVVMFHIGRSGSSVLANQFEQDGRLFWDGEVYRKYLQRLALEEDTFDPSQLDGVPPLRTAKLIRQSGPLVYGCEVKFHHLRLFGVELADFVGSLEASGATHAIVLERNNTLAKIVSSVRAHEDGTYHRHADDSRAPSRAVKLTRQINIDFGSADIVDLLQSYRRDYALVRDLLGKTNLRTMDLTYEADIEEDPTTAYRKACEFLDLEPRSIEPRLRKTRPHGSAGIENLDEVREWLSGTGFEWMCD